MISLSNPRLSLYRNTPFSPPLSIMKVLFLLLPALDSASARAAHAVLRRGSVSLLAAVATGEEADEDVDEADDAVDDGVQDVADAADYGHDGVSDGAEEVLDLLERGNVSKLRLCGWWWWWRRWLLTQDMTPPIVKVVGLFWFGVLW